MWVLDDAENFTAISPAYQGAGEDHAFCLGCAGVPGGWWRRGFYYLLVAQRWSLPSLLSQGSCKDVLHIGLCVCVCIYVGVHVYAGTCSVCVKARGQPQASLLRSCPLCLFLFFGTVSRADLEPVE